MGPVPPSTALPPTNLHNCIVYLFLCINSNVSFFCSCHPHTPKYSVDIFIWISLHLKIHLGGTDIASHLPFYFLCVSQLYSYRSHTLFIKFIPCHSPFFSCYFKWGIFPIVSSSRHHLYPWKFLISICYYFAESIYHILLLFPINFWLIILFSEYIIC